MDPIAEANDGPIVLFDGVCTMCSAWVKFLLPRSRDKALRFAPLQSSFSRDLLARMGQSALAEDDLHTVVLVESGHVFVRSNAVLRTLRHLSGIWAGAGALLVVPRPLRDAIYDFVATRRHRWFRKAPSCRVPTPDERARFLS